MAASAARAAATRGAVKRWRRVRAAFAIGQDAKMSAAMAAGTVAAVARACRGDPSDTAEPVDEAWAAARRRERTCRRPAGPRVADARRPRRAGGIRSRGNPKSVGPRDAPRLGC